MPSTLNPHPTTLTTNIAARFFAAAQQYPTKDAIREPIANSNDMRATTFKELALLVNDYSHRLQSVGVSQGMRTLMFVPPGRDFFALTFALFNIGAVPVMIDPGIGAQQMGKCLTTVDVEAFVGVPKAHVFRLLYKRVFRNLKACVTVGRRWFWGGHNLATIATAAAETDEIPTDCRAKTTATDTAAILFTSGSTGAAKGVVYTHGIFNAQVDYLQSHYGYGPDEIDLPTFPLFALFDAALGMTAVIPQMDFTRPGSVDPREIIDRIRNNDCSHMFGSPAVLKRVAEYAIKHEVSLPKLNRVITAGAPIPPQTLADFDNMLPATAKIHTPYGATESLPVASIDHREILRETAERTRQGYGTCVGQPLDGIEVKTITITDDAIAAWRDVRELPTNTIGEICVRGPIVTHEYFANETATKLAKIRDDETIWHRMGDVGYRDETGRLWFCGRKAHRVTFPASRIEFDEAQSTNEPNRTPCAKQGAETSSLEKTQALRDLRLEIENDVVTLFTVPCEAVFNEHPAVRRTALVGTGPRNNQKPILCVELEQNAAINDDKLCEELIALGQQHPHTRCVKQFLTHPGFPVDVRHNAKIFREKLAVWAADRAK